MLFREIIDESYNLIYDRCPRGVDNMLSFSQVVDYLTEGLLLELSNKLAQDIMDWMKKNKDKLSFGNLFPGGKLRVVLPMKSDDIGVSIVRKIKDQGFSIDYQNGVISDGKRTIRIGKWILGKKSGFTEKEQNWFKHQAEGIKALKDSEDSDEYAVVVSRSPLDIARMSDHEVWTSCHSEDGEYFHCAVSEAKYGGPIAYVVKKEDLEGVDLQKREIFQDSTRGIKGIVPLGRIRLRRFVNEKQGYELAIPETRIYGRAIPGFKETLRDWAYNAQQDVLKGGRPDMNEFVRVGGSYIDRDVRTADWFNNFFQDNKSIGNARYIRNDEEWLYDLYEQRCREIEEEYLSNLEFVDVIWEVVVGSDGDLYVDYSASFGGSHKVNLKKPWPAYVSGDYRNLLSSIRRLATNLEIDWIDSVYVDYHDGTIFVSVSIHGGPRSVDGFRDFANYLVRYVEPKEKEFWNGVLGILLSNGYLEASHPVAKALGYGEAEEAWEEAKFRHFEWSEGFIESGDKGIYAVSVWLVDENNKRDGILIWKSRDKVFVDNGLRTNDFRSKFLKWVIAEAEKRIKKVGMVARKQRDLWPEEQEGEKDGDFSLVLTLHPYVNIVPHGLYQAYLTMTFEISLVDDAEVAKSVIRFIEYLDNNIDVLVSVANELFERTMEFKPMAM